MLYRSVLLSGISRTCVYIPSHRASSGHRVQCSGVWIADYRLQRRRGCWHSKCWCCVQDIAAEACELAQWRHNGLEPLRRRRCQWWRTVAVMVDRSTVCHRLATCVRILCTLNSIPCSAGCRIFNKWCRWYGHACTWPAVSCRCPSLILRLCPGCRESSW